MSYVSEAREQNRSPYLRIEAPSNVLDFFGFLSPLFVFAGKPCTLPERSVDLSAGIMAENPPAGQRQASCYVPTINASSMEAP